MTVEQAMDNLMGRVAKLTDAELMDVLKAARESNADRRLIMGLSAEAYHRGLLD